MTAALVLLALGGCASVPSSPEGAVPASEAGADPSLFTRPWVWHDEHGEAVSFSKWQGTRLVVSAIFTSCTSVCPLTIEKLRAVDRAFQKKNRTVEFVLVTLDPHTDTPARLRAFKESRNLPERWHFLCGGDLETQEFGRMLHVHAVYDTVHIIHDARIAVFDQRGRLRLSFRGWDFQDDAAVIE